LCLNRIAFVVAYCDLQSLWQSENCTSQKSHIQENTSLNCTNLWDPYTSRLVSTGCRGMWSNGVALLAVLWASWTATKLFAYRSPTLRDNFFLVFYPCMLTYAAFVLLTIY